jgi:putative ABC transport system permease protein
MADRVPSRCFLLGRLVLVTIRDTQRRREIEGDLIELWRRRAAAGRRDLRRAYLRDLLGVLLVGAASLAHRMQQAISTSSSGGFAMWQDIRYALRLMGRRPAPTIAAVATLAVGIGAGLAIFTAVDRLLLRPLPFPDPDHVVHVEHAPMRLGDDVGRMIDPAFVELPVIAAAGLWAPGGVNLDDGSGSARLEAAAVDDGFFRVMGVAPLVGRPLPPPDGSSRHAVLSYDTWRARFGADRSAIGGPIVLNGRTYIVTGVMPPGFTFPGRTAVWVPPGVDPQITGQAYTPALVARIASNVTLEQARAAITIYDATRGQTRDAEMALMPLGGELTSRARPTLLLLAASSGLLLLVVCASVANLLLAGVAMREQELTVRRALGASRWRVGRQLLIESLMLSGTGAVGGVLLAVWALQALRALTPPTLDPNLLAVGLLDVRFAVAAIGVTIATALIFGAAPGVAAGAREAAYVVRLGRHDVRSPFWRRFRSALIVGQMAIALILLMASAGAVRALVATTRIDAGFAGDSAVAMTVTLPFDRFRDPGSVTGFFERAHDRLMSLPAVRRVAATSYLPGATNEGGFGLELAVPGRVRPNDAPRFSATYLSASPDYFRTMGIRVVEGRPFTPADRAGTQAVLMLSESAARGLFPDGASPIGQRVTLSGSSTPHEVVGVVTDVHLRSLTTSERALRQAYVPLLQRPPFGNLSLVVEVDGDAADHIPALTAAMREVDPSIPVYNARPVEAIVAQYYAAHHLSGTLVSSFAAITLLVAAIGLYGLMAQLVAERVREIGIRLALGAQPSAVRRGIIRYGAAHALGGVVLGALGASAALQVFGAVLPGLDAPGVGTFVLNAGVLLLAALTAVWIPASRATRADPMSALRQ